MKAKQEEKQETNGTTSPWWPSKCHWTV